MNKTESTNVVGPPYTSLAHSSTAIMRRHHVQVESGYSRSTIYLRISQGLWPKPVKLGARAVGWPASEVATLNAARIASLSDDEIRALVVSLERRRRDAGRRINPR